MNIYNNDFEGESGCKTFPEVPSMVEDDGDSYTNLCANSGDRIGSGITHRLRKPLSDDIAPDIPRDRVGMKKTKETSPSSEAEWVSSGDYPSKFNKKLIINDEEAECRAQYARDRILPSDNFHHIKGINNKAVKASSSEMVGSDASRKTSSPSSNSHGINFMTEEKNDYSQLSKGKHCNNLSQSDLVGCKSSAAGVHLATSVKPVLTPKSSGDTSLQQNACNGLKTSVQKVVQQFRPSKQSRTFLPGFRNEDTRKYCYKIVLPYELFMELYMYDAVELGPFGLTNCGNSCYANAVLQCLAFTRPITSYLIQGFHSNACRKKDWCFMCEFESLILKARKGESPLSPIRILSRIQKIGSHLGHGKEEDAHEFLRYAVDTMQAVCLKEAGAVGPLAEETTLVGQTFVGYLRSKIKCMKCLGKSELYERMMDLTVEIDGDIGSLEEALAQFTATEILDGENKYYCGRCKSYAKAKKKLTVLEAPNILTIVLKRFQSGNFGKLNKPVYFPEVLNLAPYMSGTSDKSPIYNLYGVIVHLDVMSTAFSGHYVCYVKNSGGDWFRIDDSTVIPVESERVLLEGAYMLLYARRSPRAPALLRKNVDTHACKPKKRNLEAVPSIKIRSDSNIPSTDPIVAQRKHGKYPHLSVQMFPLADSSSESSSIFSSSDASSCSTTSTKDSARSEDFSDYLFGDMGPEWYSRYRLSSNPGPWPCEGDENPAILYTDSARHRRNSSSRDTDLDPVAWGNHLDVRPSVSSLRRASVDRSAQLFY